MKKIIWMIVIAFFMIHTYSISIVNAENNGLHQEMLYEIMVDRYNNLDQEMVEQVDLEDPFAYHGGDIEGITAKLDDIKALGMTTIVLSPIMENAPMGYHGYWIEDFFQVEEQFGTLEDLNNLVEEAHDRDMKVVLEFVTNYVAKSHPLTEDTDKADWIMGEEVQAYEANEHAWTEQVHQLNQEHPDVQDLLLEAASFWIQEANIDGYVLHHADQTSPEFLQLLTEHIKKEKSDVYLIADVMTTNHAEHIYNNPNIDLVKHIELSETISDVFSKADTPVSQIYEVWKETTYEKDLLYVDNKWMKRFTQKFAENGRNAKTAWQLTMTYMYTTPGVPLIFQGSEIPMYGDFPHSQRLVDFNSGEEEVKELYTRISALRREFPVLQMGDFEQIATDRGMSLFKRTYEDDTMYVAINNDSETRTATLTNLDSGIQLRGILGDNIVRELDNGEYKIGLDRESVEVFVIEEDEGLNWIFILPIIAVFLLFITAVIYMTRKQKKREAN